MNEIDRKSERHLDFIRGYYKTSKMRPAHKTIGSTQYNSLTIWKLCNIVHFSLYRAPIMGWEMETGNWQVPIYYETSRIRLANISLSYYVATMGILNTIF